MFGYLLQKNHQMFVQLSFAKESSNVCSVIVCKRIVKCLVLVFKRIIKCLFGYHLQKNHQMFVRLSFAKESSNIRLSFPPLYILWKEASSQIVPVILNRRKKNRKNQIVLESVFGLTKPFMFFSLTVSST